MVLIGPEWPVDAHCARHTVFSGNTTIPVPGPFICEFTPWYLPQGPRRGLYSFPSGHTFSGWLPLPIALCAGRREEAVTPLHLGMIWAPVLCWGAAVGMSRVAVGAHWATDVNAASSLTWALALVLWDRYCSSDTSSSDGDDNALLVAKHAPGEV